jgi:hypothetical protein
MKEDFELIFCLDRTAVEATATTTTTSLNHCSTSTTNSNSSKYQRSGPALGIEEKENLFIIVILIVHF